MKKSIATIYGKGRKLNVPTIQRQASVEGLGEFIVETISGKALTKAFKILGENARLPEGFTPHITNARSKHPKYVLAIKARKA